MSDIAQDLGGVVRLLEDMTPGDLIVYDANEGDGWPPRPLWCFKNEAYDSGEEPALQGGIHYGGKEDADAIAAAVNFLRANSAEIAGALRDAERWQTIESAPNGAWFLVHSERGWIGLARRADPDYAPGEGYFEDEHTEYLNPAWLTHWRPLPAPPTQDAARAGERGGES